MCYGCFPLSRGGGEGPLGWLIGGQLIGIGTNIVYTRFPGKSKPERLSKGPRGSKVPKRPRAVCVFAPVTRHAWSHGRDTCDCAQIMVERKRMFQTPQRTNRPQKNRKSELEIICGPSPAGHGGSTAVQEGSVLVLSLHGLT